MTDHHYDEAMVERAAQGLLDYQLLHYDSDYFTVMDRMDALPLEEARAVLVAAGVREATPTAEEPAAAPAGPSELPDPPTRRLLFWDVRHVGRASVREPLDPFIRLALLDLDAPGGSSTEGPHVDLTVQEALRLIERLTTSISSFCRRRDIADALGRRDVGGLDAAAPGNET